ncbi:MAG TPA: methyltransferase domain-containing protein [Opitutaceae bacterium]|nr:methyltransferase domain-containing protein [Opitutaceae bacterium]
MAKTANPDKKLAVSSRGRDKPGVAVTTRALAFLRRLRHADARSLASAVLNRLWPARARLAPVILAATRGQTGLEIGGPSRVFMDGKILPVYAAAVRVDNVNFASQTAWEAGLREDGDFVFHPAKPPGRQFLREATALHGIADAGYDFLLSSHCLEHVANPLAALREWHRVVRPGGHLVLILPDPVHTFDHRRPVTTLAHLQEDFARGTGEDDLTHLDEILTLHDLRRDPWAGSAAAFAGRSRHNAENRCLHHHVFDGALQRAVLEACGWTVTATERVRPLHLLALARRPAPGDNSFPAAAGV